MATCFGLAGAAMVSAAAPAIKIQNGATWTIEANGNGGSCQLDVFNTSTHQFSSPDHHFGHDSGTWRGGAGTIRMKWTHGHDTGLTFSGTVTRKPVKEYSGIFGGISFGFTGELVKGAVAGC